MRRSCRESNPLPPRMHICDCREAVTQGVENRVKAYGNLVLPPVSVVPSGERKMSPAIRRNHDWTLAAPR